MTLACRGGAARRESVGIAFEDVARLALRRACLVSRFHPFNPERILWLRKRRRRKRRRRRRKRRRSNFLSPGGASLGPGTQQDRKRFTKRRGSSPPFDFGLPTIRRRRAPRSGSYRSRTA